MSAKQNGRLVFERNYFQEDGSTDIKCIRNHYFNSGVDVLLPGKDTMPVSLEDIIQRDMTYLTRKVHLESLLNSEFIEGFVKKGSLYMLSHGTCIDSDDCACLLPTGVLLLNLNKDTYQELGLPGTQSKAAKHTGKHVVRIDLTKKFWPGTKFYNRVRDCFQSKPNLTFDFLLTWTPEDPQVCPSSIQNFFTTTDITCNRIKLSRSSTKFTDFSVPVVSPDDYLPDRGSGCQQQSCDYLEVYEWLGACAVGVDLSSSRPDDYVSTYSCPTPSRSLPCGYQVQYRGFVSQECIQQLVTDLRQFLQSEDIPWCSVTVHGFMDSPVSWLDRDHGFYSNGDNLYTLVILPKDQYWLYMAVAGEDIVP